MIILFSVTSDISVLSTHSSSPSVPVISFHELAIATDNWNKNNVLGRGGFGEVYWGSWKNTEVAVKKINPNRETVLGTVPLHISQTLEELRLLQAYRHDNILQLYGCSADAGEPACLVYQFMSNGSVEDRLQCRKLHRSSIGDFGVSGGTLQQQSQNSRTVPLDWWQRLVIAKGTAKALQFLHTVKENPLIHGDIKSANILLDANFQPKLGDFGLAREGPMTPRTSMKVTKVHGTKPYIPDEYLRDKKLSSKVDCYGYGVVLFELCTGLKAYDEKRKQGRFLKDFVCDSLEETGYTDESLQDRKAGPDVSRVFHALLQLGKECVVRIAKRRPDMASVYQRLEDFSRQDQDKRASQASVNFPSSVNSPGLGSTHPLYLDSIPLASTSPSNPPTHSTIPTTYPGSMYPSTQSIPPSLDPQQMLHKRRYPQQHLQMYSQYSPTKQRHNMAANNISKLVIPQGQYHQGSLSPNTMQKISVLPQMQHQPVSPVVDSPDLINLGEAAVNHPHHGIPNDIPTSPSNNTTIPPAQSSQSSSEERIANSPSQIPLTVIPSIKVFPLRDVSNTSVSPTGDTDFHPSLHYSPQPVNSNGSLRQINLPSVQGNNYHQNQHPNHIKSSNQYPNPNQHHTVNSNPNKNEHPNQHVLNQHPNPAHHPNQNQHSNQHFANNYQHEHYPNPLIPTVVNDIPTVVNDIPTVVNDIPTVVNDMQSSSSLCNASESDVLLPMLTVLGVKSPSDPQESHVLQSQVVSEIHSEITSTTDLSSASSNASCSRDFAIRDTVSISAKGKSSFLD